MIERHFTADRINEIMNADGVRDAFDAPSFEGKYLDYSAFLSKTENVGLVGEYGSCILRKHQQGIYECHFAVLPEHRGPWTVCFFWDVFEYMFTQTDAVEIMSKCKVSDLASNTAAKVIGSQKMFTTKKFCESSDGPVAMNAYSMTIQNWATLAPRLVEAGEEWHHIIHALHEEDEVHNRYAGLGLLMIRGGQAIKAVQFYNRIAVMSGYQPVSILSFDPLIVDIVDAKIKIIGREFEVLNENME